MWSPVYRGRTIMLVIFNLFQTIGYYGFSSWVATLLLSQGIEVTKSLAYTFIIAMAAPIGPLVGVYFADRFERKWQIAWAATRHRRLRAAVRTADHRAGRDRLRPV